MRANSGRPPHTTEQGAARAERCGASQRADGAAFPAIGTVRATTRNDTVRKLAQQANQFVATHLTLLESSGIVDYAAPPTDESAGRQPRCTDPSSSCSGDRRDGLEL
jgi:hypothetical protein